MILIMLNMKKWLFYIVENGFANKKKLIFKYFIENE